jgi:hypothetical protein
MLVNCPEELRREIDAGLNAQQTILDSHTAIKVPLPRRKEGDAGDCNWHADFGDEEAGREDTLARTRGEMQWTYNLRQ